MLGFKHSMSFQARTAVDFTAFKTEGAVSRFLLAVSTRDIVVSTCSDGKQPYKSVVQKAGGCGVKRAVVWYGNRCATLGARYGSLSSMSIGQFVETRQTESVKTTDCLWLLEYLETDLTCAFFLELL